MINYQRAARAHFLGGCADYNINSWSGPLVLEDSNDIDMVCQVIVALINSRCGSSIAMALISSTISNFSSKVNP